jgi:hypothetical protein
MNELNDWVLSCVIHLCSYTLLHTQYVLIHMWPCVLKCGNPFSPSVNVIHSSFSPIYLQISGLCCVIGWRHEVKWLAPWVRSNAVPAMASRSATVYLATKWRTQPGRVFCVLGLSSSVTLTTMKVKRYYWMKFHRTARVSGLLFGLLSCKATCVNWVARSRVQSCCVQFLKCSALWNVLLYQKHFVS